MLSKECNEGHDNTILKNHEPQNLKPNAEAFGKEDFAIEDVSNKNDTTR